MYNKLIEMYEAYISNLDKKIYSELKNSKDKSDRIIDSIVRNHQYFEIALSNDCIPEIERGIVSGKYFPNDFSVDRGNSYEVDFAVFKIPINNGGKIFSYTGNVLPSYVDSLEIKENQVIISICSYSANLKEDDKKILEIKEKAKKYISEIGVILSEINKMNKEYCDKLSSQIQSFYNIIINEEKKEKEAINKINPFK